VTSAPATSTPPVRAVPDDEFTAEHHVYEPHKIGLPPLGPYVKALWQRREFAVEMARTELRSQHFNSAFGQLWLLLNPLLLAGVYFVLVDILRSGSRPAGFFAHLMAGLFAYYFVSGAVRAATRSVTSGGKLILNSAFPRTLLPLSEVLVAFIRFLPTIVIYVPVHLISGRPVGLVDLWLIPLLALLVILVSGLAMLVAALQVYFRDLKDFLPYLLRVWLYASPVLYYAHEVPGRYALILKVNPLGGLLTAWSDVLIGGRSPYATSLALAAGWAFALFVGGALFFISREREFAVRI
jgi:ABC-type polysaccharide/polyol phosphate export permease